MEKDFTTPGTAISMAMMEIHALRDHIRSNSANITTL